MKEAALFDYLTSYLPDLKGADDRMSRWDAVSERHKMYIELKCRGAHYPDLLLEEKKYTALTERARARGFDPIYITSTPRGVYVFRLDQLEPKWETRKMPKTSQFSDRSWIDKSVYMIPVSHAVKVLPLP